MKQTVLWWLRGRAHDPLLRRYTKLLRKQHEIEKTLKRIERLLERRGRKDGLPIIHF